MNGIVLREDERMKIAYVRVSTTDQNVEMQLMAIKDKYGEVDRIYQEQASGKKNDRPELQKALDALRAGDTFIVYKVDRLARSTVKLLSILNELREKQVQFVSISDNLDTSTPAGRAMFGMLAIFAEFEHSIIVERTRAGLASARARGISLGRTRTDSRKVDKALKLYDAKTHVIKEICDITGVSRSVLYRAIKDREDFEK